MSKHPGNPLVHSHLTTAVRKALFTSAAVATAAVFTPTTLAETAPASHLVTPQILENKAAVKEQQETVVDLTKISQADASECKGQDCSQSQTDNEGINEIRISNDSSLVRDDASVELVGSDYNAEGVVDRQDEFGNNNQAADSIVGIGNEWTEQNYLTDEDEEENRFPTHEQLHVEFTDEDVIEPNADDAWQKLHDLLAANGFDGEIKNYNGRDLSEEEFYDIFTTQGGDFSVHVAEEDSAIITDASGIRADSESGDIVINNTGDIEVGSGEKKEYWTDVQTHTIYSSNWFVERNDKRYSISLNGNWIDQGEGKRLDATAYAAGIKATSVEGNITITNEGSVSSVTRDDNGLVNGVGEVATAIEAGTHLGDIVITNTGNVSVGAGSAGITAHAKQFSGDMVISGEGEDGAVVEKDFSETMSFSYVNGANSYAMQRERVEVDPAAYVLDDNGDIALVDGERQIERAKVTTTYKYYYADVNLKNIDGTDSTIEITNGELGSDTGSINISGNDSFGIIAQNPSGDSVNITNHGDIEFASSADESLTSGVGIFVDTTAYNRDINKQLLMAADACEGQLTDAGSCVIGSGENLGTQIKLENTNVDLFSEMTVIRHFEATNFFGDGGDIEITNSGDIDISDIAADQRGGTVAAIHAASYGNIAINNSGNISVGEWSSGISTLRPGETAVLNDGGVSLTGEGARGIDIVSLTVPLATDDMSLSQLEMFGGGVTDFIQQNHGTFHNGDTVVVNSGDIITDSAGHSYTLDDQGRIEGYVNDNDQFVPEGVAWGQMGISVSAVNANKRGTDMPWNTYGQDAIDYFNDNGSDIADVTEGVEFYDIDVVNSGDITMGRAGTGIQVAGVYGEAFLTHTTAEGADTPATISVDDSLVFKTTDESGFLVRQSVGVVMRPAGQSWTDNHFINEANIEVGDAGIGARIYAGFGSSYAQNKGSITVGDGIVITRAEGEEDEGTARVTSVGMTASVDGGFNDYAKATNHGQITTGDHSFGMTARNASTGWTSSLVPDLLTTYADLSEESQALVDKDHMRESTVYTATAINREDGVIITGDHSIGIFTSGKYNQGINQGKVFVGAGGDTEQYSLLTRIEMNEQQELIDQGVEIAEQDLVTFEQRSAGMASLDSGSNISLLINQNEISSEMLSESGDTLKDDEGNVLFHDSTIGIYAKSLGFAIAGNEGGITLGDDSIGLFSRAASAGQAVNRSEIVVGDDSIGVHAEALASATALNQGIINTGDNGIGVLAEGRFATAYNVFEISSENNADTGMAVGVKATGTQAAGFNFYSFSTIDMGENSVGIDVTAESLAADPVLVNATYVNDAGSNSYLWARVNDDDGIAIELTEEEFEAFSEEHQGEGYNRGAKIVNVLDADGNEITRQQEEYVLDDDGEIVINEETGHPLTQPVFDEDGNPVMLVKQEQAVNEEGEELNYLLKQAQAITVTPGSISFGSAINGGTITATDGMVLTGIRTETSVETLDMFEIADGKVQNMTFNHGSFGSVLTAQNSGEIVAENIAIDVNNATNAQIVNAGSLEAKTAIEIDITAVKEHTRSQLAYKPAVDEDGKPIVLPYYDYTKPILDEDGQFLRDEDGQVQYETFKGATGDTIYLQGTQGEFSEMVDENGHNMVDWQGNQLYVQNIEEIDVDAAVHSAFISNSGVITADQGIVITANDDGATFNDDQLGTVIIDNSGVIDAKDSIAVVSVSGDVNVSITNSGSINGNIVTTDGSDLFYNGLNATGTAAGQIAMNDTTFDFKGGNNQMVNRFGDITFAGHNEIKLGTYEETYFGNKEVQVNVAGETVTKVVVDEENELTRIANGTFTNRSSTQSFVTISSINGSANDTLVISGDMNMLTTGSNSGLITIETSMAGSDQIIIEGDLTVAQENGLGEVAVEENGELTHVHNINMQVAPASQQKGAQSLVLVSNDEADNAVITVKGEATYNEVEVQSVVGDFADTVVKAEVISAEDSDDGKQRLEIVYGLADVGVAASSTAHIAANYWHESVGKFQDRRATAQSGFSAFVNNFHTDSDVGLNGDIDEQDIGFAQRISGMQAGFNYAVNNWVFSAYVGEGDARASMAEPHQSESRTEFTSWGVTAGYAIDKLYIDAVIQASKFESHVNAYNTSGWTTGSAKGLSLEAGYEINLDSGYNLVPQLQVSAVDVVVNPYRDANKVYGFVFDNELNTQTRLGLNINRNFEQSTGLIQPFATLSLINIQGENTINSNNVPFLSDMTGVGYALDAGVNSQYKAWTIDGQLGIYDGETNKNGLSIQLSVGYKW